MNIVLIGLRGSGKTAVGKLLAAKLGLDFHDSDDLIVRRAGMPVPEIVTRLGWDKFRDIESAVITDLAEHNNIIIATGGGIVEREANVTALRRRGRLVWLRAAAATLLARIGDDANRPSLTGQSPTADMETVLAKRRPLYESAADFTIDTGNLSPEEVAQQVIDYVNREPAGNTTLCGVIGHPIGHSLSPLLHNRSYSALGMDYLYTPRDTADAATAITAMRRLNIRGLSVTIPHKETIIKHLDSVADNALALGAVNTVINEGGSLHGYNTDGKAALRAITEVIEVRGKKAVIAGAGGAGAAIGYELIAAGAEVKIIDLYPERAAVLAKRLGAADGLGMEAAAIISEADILVNSTPVGMWPDTEKMAVPEAVLHEDMTVFDAVYNPQETLLLRRARAAGARIIYGYKMFLYQAAAQFEMFTGREAPLAVMESTLQEALGGK